jgi:hypothetical protein
MDKKNKYTPNYITQSNARKHSCDFEPHGNIKSIYNVRHYYVELLSERVKSQQLTSTDTDGGENRTQNGHTHSL